MLKTEQIIFIPVENIHVVEGRNKRFDSSEVDHIQLIGSIIENGVIKPIEVQSRVGVKNHYDLVDGHRRYEACQSIKEKYSSVPTKDGRPVTHIRSTIVDLKSESDVLTHMLVSNDSRPFNPLEEAMMIVQLKEESGLDVKGIAKRIGKSISHISDRLALLSAADEIQDAVAEGTITSSDATTIVRKSHGNQEAQKTFIKKVKVEGRSVIKKELTKGRYKKEQWEVAEKVFDDFNAAYVSPDTFVSTTIKDSNDVDEVISHIINDPNLEVAFQLGKVLGVGALGYLTPAEILNKLTRRIIGADGKYTEEKK